MPTSTDNKLIRSMARDPRGVWMRQNTHCMPFAEGRFAGKPMHGLRIATIVANAKRA